jgi:hypothetical protein
MAFVVADLVGPGGEVVGIERAPEAVAQTHSTHASARARKRAPRPGRHPRRAREPPLRRRRHALASRALAWVGAAFERAEIQPELGPRLWQVLEDAGLEPLGMTSIQPHFGPTDTDGHALLAGIVRTLLPVIEATGVASVEEVDVDTLHHRLGEELTTTRAVFAHPALTCAWSIV